MVKVGQSFSCIIDIIDNCNNFFALANIRSINLAKNSLERFLSVDNENLHQKHSKAPQPNTFSILFPTVLPTNIPALRLPFLCCLQQKI